LRIALSVGIAPVNLDMLAIACTLRYHHISVAFTSKSKLSKKMKTKKNETKIRTSVLPQSSTKAQPTGPLSYHQTETKPIGAAKLMSKSQARDGRLL